MTNVVSLFSDQESAGKAVKALSDAGFEDANTFTLEDWDPNATSEPIEVPIHAGHAASSVTVPPIQTVLPNLNLDNESEHFIKQSLQKGGVLVIIEPSNDEKIPQIQEILEEEGGQVTV